MISRRRLNDSIAKGLQHLARKTSRDGKFATRAYRYRDGAGEALVALAALEAGGDPASPGLAAILKRLAEQNPRRTAARALRAMVCARLGDSHSEALHRDVQWLIHTRRDDGGWGETPDAPANLFDSALATLALGRADRLGEEINPTIWDRTKQFLLVAQNPDGGYGYEFLADRKKRRLRGSSHGSATAAAAAMWAVLIDRKQLPPDDENRNPLWESFGKTAHWLERNFNLKTVPRWYWGDAPEQTYRHLLLLASPALQSSRPQWSALPGQLVVLLLDRQSDDGAWVSPPLAEDDAISTAWAVLTLTRARQELQAARPAPTKIAPAFRPGLLLVIGRIHHAGDWDILEHTEAQWSDALAGAVSVGLKRRDVFAGQDYDPNVALVHLTGTKLAGFGAPARAALKTYLSRGGMVLIDPAGGGQEFFDQTKAMLETMYGPNSVPPVPADHPIITGHFAGDIGSDVSAARYTPTAAKQTGRKIGPPILRAVRDKNRVVAVLSRYSLAIPTTDDADSDIAHPLAGYHPDDAKRLAINILLYTYAARQQAVGLATSKP